MIRIFPAALALALIFLPASPSLNAQEKESSKAASTAEKNPSRPPEDVNTLLAKSEQAYADKNWVLLYANNMKLLKLRPYSPEAMLNIVRAAAQLGRRSTALHYMLKMQQQGLSYDFNTVEETVPLRGTEAYDHINGLLVEAGQPSGDGSRAFTLAGDPTDFSDIAWDESRGKFLLATRKEGRVIAVAPDGTADELLRANEFNGFWSINGITVDAGNNRLWMTTSATPAFDGLSPTDLNRGALLEYELDSLRPVAWHNVPVDGLVHELGHLAMAENGDIYMVDWATPIIYRKKAASKKLEAFAGSTKLVQLTDIAVAPDSSRLFVADAELGVLLIDPKTRRSAMLAGDENLNLGGVYGLEFVGGNLLVMQSGISPQRLLRLEIDAGGTSVTNVSPMAINLPGFDVPGASVIRDEKVFYLANQGSMSGAGTLEVMETPLDAGSNIKPPDMRQFEKALRARQNQ